MNKFKKDIFKITEEIPGTVVRLYNVLEGDQSCVDGYVNITNTSPLTVYTTELLGDWTVGTILYSDVLLTTPIGTTFIKSVVAGVIDLFFMDVDVSGAISEIYFTNTPCL